MPILDDILQHRVLGREYKRGRLEGELKIIRMQIEKRFGPLPDWAEQSLRNMTVDELEILADCGFEVQNLSYSCNRGDAAEYRGRAIILGILASRI
jgi:hypothetical protein